jgi:hypothetical protein
MEHTTDVYQDAIETWGEHAQLDMVIEECAELIKEVCKWQRKGKMPETVLDELADVQIMLTQLENICSKHNPKARETIATTKTFKLNRLRERLEAWKHERPHTH